MGTDYPPPSGTDPTRPPVPPTGQPSGQEWQPARPGQDFPREPDAARPDSSHEGTGYPAASEYPSLSEQSAYAPPPDHQPYSAPDYRATGRYPAAESAYAPASYQPTSGYSGYPPGPVFPPAPGPGPQSAYAPPQSYQPVPSAYQPVTGYPPAAAYPPQPYQNYPPAPMAPAMPGYPPPGGPGAHHAPPPVSAASVLGYVEAGMLFLLGMLVLAAGAVIGRTLGEEGAPIAIIGLVPITLGVLFILATRQLQTGKGRTFLLVLAILAALFHALSLLGDLAGNTGSSAVVLGLALLGVPVAIIVLLFQKPTNDWVAAHQGAPFPGSRG